jgi:hypothetical protein
MKGHDSESRTERTHQPPEPGSAVGEHVLAWRRFPDLSVRLAPFDKAQGAVSVVERRHPRLPDRYAPRRGKAPQRGCRAGDPANQQPLACPAVAAVMTRAAKAGRVPALRRRLLRMARPDGSSGGAPAPTDAFQNRGLLFR